MSIKNTVKFLAVKGITFSSYKTQPFVLICFPRAQDRWATTRTTELNKKCILKS